MEYNLLEKQGVPVLVLQGDAKGDDAKELSAVLEKAFAKGAKCICLNLTDLDFIDSTCIGSLMAAKENADETGVQIMMCGLSEDVKDLFEMTRMDVVFDIYLDEPEMLAKAGRAS